VNANGFSQKACQPRASTAGTTARREPTGVAMSTASTSGHSPTSANARGMPYVFATAEAAAIARSHTQATVTSGMFTSTGRCDPDVTMPAPTIPILILGRFDSLKSLLVSLVLLIREVPTFPESCTARNESMSCTSVALARCGAGLAPMRCVDEFFGNGLPQMRKLRVAIVAPSLRILGGQAVQAQRLLDAWSNDPEVDAWLVPVNPAPP